MPHRHRDRRRGYRRGLLLGFTMSEVMLLLVFALLLSLGVIIKKLAADLQEAEAGLNSCNAAAAAAAVKDCPGKLEEVERNVTGGSGNEFDEWFTELRLVTEKAKKWDRLTATVPDLADDSFAAERLIPCLTLPESGADERPTVAPCAEELAQCKQKQADAEKQTEHWRDQAQAIAGRGGLDYPPCWPDGSGKPEYIFEIVIFDHGLTVRDIAPEGRRTEVDGLGLGAELYGESQSAAVFEARTRVIAEKSRKDNCRHFVRVIDRTTTKAAYKSQLQSIERHFYKFERPS